MKLKLCTSPEEQEQSKLLIAELMTNEVAAAEIEVFNVDEDGGGYGCGDLLSTLTELIGRGGSYLKALKQLRCVCHIACSPRF